MNYMLELESPDFEELCASIAAQLIAIDQMLHNVRRDMGVTHTHTLAVTRKRAAILRALAALGKAKANAKPERAVPPVGVTYQRPVDSDERAFVAGRPRNDPRNARSKPTAVLRS